MLFNPSLTIHRARSWMGRGAGDWTSALRHARWPVRLGLFQKHQKSPCFISELCLLRQMYILHLYQHSKYLHFFFMIYSISLCPFCQKQRFVIHKVKLKNSGERWSFSLFIISQFYPQAFIHHYPCCTCISHFNCCCQCLKEKCVFCSSVRG